MHRLMMKYMRYGTQEMFRSLWINAQVKQLQRFVPELSLKDVTRYGTLFFSGTPVSQVSSYCITLQRPGWS